MKIVVIVTDDSLGVEALPEGVEVEIRDYRAASVAYYRRHGAVVSYNDGGPEYVAFDFASKETSP